MANFFVAAFSDVDSWFKKVFSKAPNVTATALAVLNTAAPIFEAVIAIVDPALATVADPIITTIQADLGTVAAMLKNGNITGVGSFLSAIKANFSTLLSEGHITDTESVAKANAFLGIIDSIASDLGVTL
ncbi:MAG: hypothetical protein ACLQVL_36800 [Terriglobia bacterium]